jgi:glycosyltransferase involved in cell wall biosynthesis
MSKNLSVLFLGFAIPDAMMDEVASRDHYQPQIAAHKLQWNIISGLEEAMGKPIDLLSAVATSDYPSFPQVLFPYSKFEHRQGARDALIPCVNIVFVKQVTRFIACFVLLLSWLLEHRGDTDKLILVYSMHSPLLLSALLARAVVSAKVVLIVPDLPAYMDFGIQRGLLRRMTKPIDSALLVRAMRRVQGLIALTQYIAQDLAPALPVLVMEGVIRIDETECPPPNDGLALRVSSDEAMVVCAGALVQEYGIELLLKASTLLKDRRYRFGFCGKGPMEQAIRQAVRRDDRVVYWGFLSQHELQPKLRSATVLVHPRLSNAKYVRYSFPSKLLEYMKAGRPVISTALPGIPEEYFEYLYVLYDETAEGLARLLSEVCSKTDEELDKFGLRAKKFVESKKNHVRQGQRIYEFLAHL